MIGHEQIISYRREGKKPSCIFVKFDAQPEKSHYDFDKPERQLDYGFYPTVYVSSDEIPDVRFLTGCNVLVSGVEWSDKFTDFLDKITKIQPTQIIANCFPADGLMIWENKEWSAHAGI